MSLKVLIGTSSFAELDKTPLEKLFNTGLSVIDNSYKRKMNREEIQSLLKQDVVGILAGLEPLDREILKQSSLKVISRVGAGMTNVDIEAAREFNIAVFNTPDAPTNAVAELVIGALISLLRWIPQANETLHQKGWSRQIGSQIEGKTIAIIGFGRIGRRIAELLQPFHAKLIAVDPYLNESKQLPYPLLSIKEALPMADIITIHTNGKDLLFDEAEFSLMKRGSLLLNAARGNIVSEKALINAIDAGIVAGAWLDTFETEPYKGHLCNYKNVILTPHIGSYTAECRQKMENEAVDNLLKVLKPKR